MSASLLTEMAGNLGISLTFSCRLLCLLCVYPGFASLCHMTRLESQQPSSHPAAVLESLVLRELKILDLGSKKTP